MARKKDCSRLKGNENLRCRHDRLIESTIKSFSRKHGIREKGGFLWRGDISLTHFDTQQNRERTLAFLEGYNEGQEFELLKRRRR